MQIKKTRLKFAIPAIFFFIVLSSGLSIAYAAPAFFFSKENKDSRIAVGRLVVFGDSLSDTGNVQALFKELTKTVPSTRIIEKPFIATINHSQLAAPIKIILIKELGRLARLATNAVSESGAISVIPYPPYDGGRFSNGPVWSEWLGQNLSNINVSNSTQFINRAYAGSFAIGLKDQLKLDIEHPINFIKHLKASLEMIINGKLLPPSLDFLTDAYIAEYPETDNYPDTLYTILDGGNDYLNADVDDLNTTTAPEVVVNSICSNATKLANFAVQKATAKSYIALMTLPDLSLTPWYSKPPFNQQQSLIHSLVVQHNQRLVQCQQTLSANPKYQDKVNFLIIDTAAAQQTVIDALPDSFNQTDACFTGGPFLQSDKSISLPAPLSQVSENVAGSECSDPDLHVFWDDVHPTRIIHAKVFRQLCLELSITFKMSCEIPADISNKKDWPKTVLNP